jgi:threonine dehydratase
VAQERANVISVDHHREGMAVPVYQSEIELTLAMRDEHHCSVLLETLRSLGYQVERLR